MTPARAAPGHPGRPDWHGRRRGHRLRPARQRLVRELLPRLCVDPGPGTGAMIDLERLFGRAMAAYRLEIGFGAGEHLAAQAQANPACGFIGCEPFVNGVASLLAQIETLGLENVRVHDDDARLILDRLPEARFERIDVLYPDPWPKLRHHKRRLIQAASVAGFARLLADGGSLVFATDHAAYARWALALALAEPALRWSARRARDWRQAPPDWIETRYEAKARARGLRPIYLVFRRRARDGGNPPERA